MKSLLRTKNGKYISLILAVVICFSVLAIPAQATYYNHAYVVKTYDQDFRDAIPYGNPYNFTYTNIYYNTGYYISDITNELIYDSFIDWLLGNYTRRYTYHYECY